MTPPQGNTDPGLTAPQWVARTARYRGRIVIWPWLSAPAGTVPGRDY